MNKKKGNKPKERNDSSLVNYKDLERNVLSEISKELYQNKNKTGGK